MPYGETLIRTQINMNSTNFSFKQIYIKENKGSGFI